MVAIDVINKTVCVTIPHRLRGCRVEGEDVVADSSLIAGHFRGVAHAAHSSDRTVITEFGPQLGYVDVDGAAAHYRRVPPHFREKLISTEHPTGLGNQMREQINSVAVKSTGSSPTHTRRRIVSIDTAPTDKGSLELRLTRERRTRDLTRATISRGLKGLVT